MFRKNASNDKKKVLLAQKERLLQEIKYYEKRIEEFPAANSCVYYGGNSSSDSEDDFPSTLDVGPSISELKHQARLLGTCLQATQELTSLGILQSEVNVMIEDPVLEGEKPVIEPGTWREVTAECRIDLVPFSITFYTHQPSRRFAARSYRGLRVLPVKTAHEVELSKSMLSHLANPSDAIEVLRSYAVAYRSRRTTLARLADKYASSLFMEPQAEGGFVLKCANLLEMSWCLDNKLSAVAPFHHKLNFELEYMNESYLKIIKQAHRQLSDPSLQTDERTLLLSKIISTCLEAQTQIQESNESMESDPESIKKHEKTTLDEDSDGETVNERDNTEAHKRKRDEEVMAPPKSIPKKAKPKGKENMDENRKSVKRTGSFDNGNVKKARTEDVRFSITDIVKRNEANVENKTKGSAVNKKNNEKEQSDKDNDNANQSEKVDKPKQLVNIDRSNKVMDKVVNVDKITSSVKNAAANNKDGAKSSDNNNAPAKKITKNDKNSKNGQKSTDVETNKIIAKKKADNEKNKPAKNVDTEKNTLVKNTGTAKNDEVKNKNIDGKKKNNVGKATGTNEPKSTNQKLPNPENKDVSPKNSKTVQNKKINEENKQNDNIRAKESQIPANNKKIDNSNDKKNVIDNKNNKNSGNSDINAKKSVISDPVIKKSVNSLSNVKKNVTSDLNVKKNAKLLPDNAKKSVNTNTKSDTVEKTSKVNSVVVNNKEQLAEHNNDKNIANTKNSVNIATKHKVTEIAKTTSTESAKVKNVAINKDAVSTKKNHGNPANNKINNTKDLPKNHIKTQNIAKNTEKSKMIIKNHRNSTGKVAKKSINAKTLKINDESGIHSKIPKKLSPAYAAALKQNPIRISPRMLSKFKSPSDTNIQTKLFKPITNIPRLLKKPAPKSK